MHLHNSIIRFPSSLLNRLFYNYTTAHTFAIRWRDTYFNLFSICKFLDIFIELVLLLYGFHSVGRIQWHKVDSQFRFDSSRFHHPENSCTDVIRYCTRKFCEPWESLPYLIFCLCWTILSTWTTTLPRPWPLFHRNNTNFTFSNPIKNFFLVVKHEFTISIKTIVSYFFTVSFCIA